MKKKKNGFNFDFVFYLWDLVLFFGLAYIRIEPIL